MLDLPYEIWLQIIEYLSDHQVRTLYSVNRAFCDMALDLRYRNASLGILPDQVIEETKPPILSLSSRATSLEIAFYDTSNRTGPDVIQTGMILPTMGHKPEEVTQPTARLAQLLHAMTKFTRVTNLSFASGPYVLDHGAASLVLPESVGFLGNRLQALHIQSPFVAYLPPRIESLKSFSLDALTPYHTDELNPIVVEKIPAFVQAHASTLREVSFSIKSLTLDISPILQCLLLISCLQNLRLSLPYCVGTSNTTKNPLEQVCQILEAHQNHLASLSLVYSDDRIPTSGCWRGPVRGVFTCFHAPWGLSELSNLKHLTLCLRCSQHDAKYIIPFTHSLVSLKVVAFPYKFPFFPFEVEWVCETWLSKFLYLRELDLLVIRFELKHLISFARTLPHLLSLHLDCESYLPVSNSVPLPINAGTLFSDWALESLNCKSAKSDLDYDRLEWEIAIQLPNVLWINNKTRKECLSTAYSEHIDFGDCPPS